VTAKTPVLEFFQTKLMVSGHISECHTGSSEERVNSKKFAVMSHGCK